MATVGRTLFRCGGALLLGASATAIDDPGVLFAPSLESRTPKVSVVVATRDLPQGAIIGRTDLAVAQWPVGTQPAGVYTSVDSVAGRVARVSVFKGEAIVPGRLAARGTKPGLEVKITPGKRAFGFRISDVTGIAGLIQPNSRVDVLVVFDGRPGERRMAKIFMENMRVLAIGSVPDQDSKGRSINAAVVTLEVTPEQAERLAIARTQGDIQLALRGYGDPDSISASGDYRTGVVVPPTGCDPPASQGIVRDLLRRTCAKEMRFRKDSAAAVVVPRR